MNENEDLISRLRAIGQRAVDGDVAAGHLNAIKETAGPGVARPGRRHRLQVVAAVVVGLLAGTSGLATAGALPHGAQEIAHSTLGAVGVKVPHGDRYQGPECGGEVKNHGQYVRSQPKEKRAEAAKSRCGKPIQAGTGEETGGATDGKAAGCQGPPPWAGKGKPDPAAKAARKQACGEGDESGGEKKTPAPATETQPGAPSTENPPSSSTTATTAPSTATTGTTDSSETTVTSPTTPTTATTPTTSGSEGDTTSTTAANLPAVVPGS